MHFESKLVFVNYKSEIKTLFITTVIMLRYLFVVTFSLVIDASTSRSRDVTNIAGFWSKRAPKTIEVNRNRVEFCFYFLMYH